MSKKIAKKKTNESVKQQLLNSWQENDDIEEPTVRNCQEAILIIHS